ncbi:MAG TPA: dTDP-4-dehydrorhamnose reductase [Pyrinomonadaceae bacterium]|nr:dTDP-4-dehydrorhamnose reductase [Pyrinomonadaceae bacterium]
MKVLITGAGGLVGTSLVKRFSKRHTVIAPDHVGLDITDRDQLFETVIGERPDLIFNCAVIGVDECELNPDRARAVNINGPCNLAEAASRVSSAMVHFSTNYVFDGLRESGFYSVDDEPRPISIYGRTKWEGEQAVIAACKKSFIIRTSWVYGGGAKGFFDKAIASLRVGETIEAVSDNWASTTFVEDLVERVEKIVEHGHYGTYHVVNGGICSKYEFATEAARLIHGSDDLVKPVAEAHAGLIGKRPRYTPMRCKLSDGIGLPPMRDWRLSLREVVSRRAGSEGQYI